LLNEKDQLSLLSECCLRDLASPEGTSFMPIAILLVMEFIAPAICAISASLLGSFAIALISS